MASSVVVPVSLGRVTIVGSGLIGRSWSALFARRGYEVCLFDTVSSQLETAHLILETLLGQWEAEGRRGGQNRSSKDSILEFIGRFSESSCVCPGVCTREGTAEGAGVQTDRRAGRN